MPSLSTLFCGLFHLLLFFCQKCKFIRRKKILQILSILGGLKEVHGDRNATYKNLGTWAGPVMLLSDM